MLDTLNLRVLFHLKCKKKFLPLTLVKLPIINTSNTEKKFEKQRTKLGFRKNVRVNIE